MPKEVYDWSATDASNNFSPSDGGWPENMERALVNNAARADLGALRRWYNDPEFLNLYAEPLRVVSKVTDTSFRVAGVDATGDFPTDRRVRVTDGTTTVSGYVTGASFAAGDTTVTVLLDSGVIPAATNKALVHHSKTIKKLAFRNTLPMDSVFDVKQDYGATGDGTTNDAAAIQAAIDAAEAAGGGTVFFPSGRYRVNTGLTVTVNKVKLVGEGHFSSILLSGSSTSYVVTFGDNATEIEGVELHDLGFTALGGVVCTAGGAVLFQKCPRAVVRNVSVYGPQILSGTSLFRGIDTNGVTGRHLHCQWSNLFILDCIEDGIRLQNGGACLLSDIWVATCGGVGIRFDTCDFLVVANVWVNGCGGEAGILLDDTLVNVAPVSGAQHDCSFANVQSNVNQHHGWIIRFCSLTTFVGCMAQFAANNVDEDGFLLDSSASPGNNVKDLIFSGCAALDNDRHGWNLDSVARVCIEACFASRNSDGGVAGAGIRLQNSNDCSISANNVGEQAAGGTQKYGILIEGTSGATGANLIQGNLSRGNITKEFEDTSSGANLWRNNRGDDAMPTTSSGTATLPIPNLTDSMVTMTSVVQTDFFTGHTHIGKPFTIVCQGAVTFRHIGGGTGNLRLAGSVNVSATAGSRISFAYDGTNYVETGRSLA